MTTKNDITGDPIRSKALSEQGRANWDRIFKKPKEDDDMGCGKGKKKGGKGK